MLKLFSSITVVCLLFLLTFFQLSFLSCKKHDNTAQIRRIDSLINRNNNANSLLIIDLSAIKQRVDSMKIKIKSFDSNTIKSSGVQLKSDLILYNGLLIRYIDFLDDYPDAEYRNSINSRFLDDLRNKILDHQIKTTVLDTMLIRQEKIIRSDFEHTQEIVQTIFSIEDMYQRLNNKINSVYE